MLQDEVLEEVPHAMWVFTLPKMLRIYFLYHRELLGELSRAAYETLRELMVAAAFEDDSFRPGMVSVVQTFLLPVDLRGQPTQHLVPSKEPDAADWRSRSIPPACACPLFLRRLECFWRVDFAAGSPS